MKKQTLKSCLTLGAALGVVTLAQVAQAQTSSSSSTSTSMSSSMSSQPMMVSGKVNNYWTDASGYVTGVDIQTANGPAVVHFVPGMGNRLMQTYPIGSTANLWVQGSMQGGTQHWDLVGMGDKMPAAGFWPVMDSSGLDIANDWPLVMTGAERVTIEGKLRRVAVDKMGQVIGLVLDTTMASRGTPTTRLGSLVRGDTIWQSDAMGGSTGGNWSLVRVGPEYRSAPHHGDMRRVTPLMVGDEILATGYMEAPRYGALSPYSQRLIASAIVVNGQTVGQEGFPTMKLQEPTVFGFDFNIPFLTGKAPDTLQVVPGGYEVYNGSSAGSMNNPTR